MKNKENLTEMKRKIVCIIKEKYRLMNIHKEVLYQFVKEHTDASVNSRTLKKDLILLAEEYLSPDTLEQFFELDRFGLAKGDLPIVMNATEGTIQKLIDSEQIRLLDTLRLSGTVAGTVYLHVYSIPDILRLEREGLIKHRGEVHVKNYKLTDENIVQALYMIDECDKKKSNKSLKDLKDAVISKLSDEGKASLVEFNDYKPNGKNDMILMEAVKILERYVEK